MADCAGKLTTAEAGKLADAVYYLARNVAVALAAVPGAPVTAERAMIDVAKVVPWPRSLSQPPEQPRLCEAARIAYDGWLLARRLTADWPADRQIAAHPEVVAMADTVARALGIAAVRPTARPSAAWTVAWAAAVTLVVGGAAWALTRS